MGKRKQRDEEFKEEKWVKKMKRMQKKLKEYERRMTDRSK